MTTNRYIHGVKHHNWPLFAGRLWQRNYFERVIRDDIELDNIREYIHNNPTTSHPP
jgi:REP element-mobilizing transposase RayT